MRNSPGKSACYCIGNSDFSFLFKRVKTNFSMTSSCVTDNPLDSKYSCKNPADKEQCLLQTALNTCVSPLLVTFLPLVDKVFLLGLGVSLVCKHLAEGSLVLMMVLVGVLFLS